MSTDNRGEMGETIKQLRASVPLTLKLLAENSGVSSAHLCRIEKGERFPSARILRKIAKPLGVSETELLVVAGYAPAEPSAEAEIPRRLKTKVFELSNGRYSNLSELAHAMGIVASQVYRVRQGKRPVSEKFIIGAKKAFPEYKLDDLFYVVPDGSEATDSRSDLGAKGNLVGMQQPSETRRDGLVKLRNTGLSYAEIGRRLGVSRERARQIVVGKPSQQKPDLQLKAVLTISDVARLLNVHINTVRRWSNQGILKSYHIGSRGDRRFRREDVDAFLGKPATKAEEVSSEQLIPTSAVLPSGMRRKRLTDRQLEILKLVAKGLDSKEIAERLSITEHTIKNQIYVACRCIGAANRAHAIAILYEQGWLEKGGD